MSEKCAECGNTFRAGLIWKSEVTTEMVTHLDNEQLASLILALDEAVITICSEMEVN